MTDIDLDQQSFLDALRQNREIWPPLDEPVRGIHVAEFKRRHFLDLNQMEALFGIASREAWYKMTKVFDPHQLDHIPIVTAEEKEGARRAIEEDPNLTMAEKAARLEALDEQMLTAEEKSRKLDELRERQRGEEPVDRAVAIMLRVLSAMPELIPVKEVNIEQLMNDVGKEPGEFAMMLGRMDVSGHDWLQGTTPTKIVKKLMQMLREQIDLRGVHDNPFLEALKAFSQLEWSLVSQADPSLAKRLQKRRPRASESTRRRRRSKQTVDAERQILAPISPDDDED